MENNKKYAGLFDNNPDISFEEKVRVINELSKIGSLTFTIETSDEGWTAQCNEIEGIIAGNSNPNPSSVEIESQIREAVYAAFDVKVEKKSVPSPIGDSFGYVLRSGLKVA